MAIKTIICEPRSQCRDPTANRAAEMEIFVRIVELGGFTAAARAFGLTPSGVSKLVSRMEARLGARLLNRSTRRYHPDSRGAGLPRPRRAHPRRPIDEAEREAAAGAPARPPAGQQQYPVRHALPDAADPRLPGHASRGIRIDMMLSDTVIDLMEERADIADPDRADARFQPGGRKLGASRMVIVASPDYLARHGMPEAPADLAAHRGIGWTFARTIGGWPFLRDGRIEERLPPTVARASDGDVARLFALGGTGLARLANFHVGPDIAAGTLVPVMEALNPGDSEDIHAVYLGGTGPVPARVRAFVDFVAARCRLPGD
jgi:DNA-binding transcriptional LysR family regulator